MAVWEHGSIEYMHDTHLQDTSILSLGGLGMRTGIQTSPCSSHETNSNIRHKTYRSRQISRSHAGHYERPCQGLRMTEKFRTRTLRTNRAMQEIETDQCST